MPLPPSTSRPSQNAAERPHIFESAQSQLCCSPASQQPCHGSIFRALQAKPHPLPNARAPPATAHIKRRQRRHTSSNKFHNKTKSPNGQHTLRPRRRPRRYHHHPGFAQAAPRQRKRSTIVLLHVPRAGGFGRLRPGSLVPWRQSGRSFCRSRPRIGTGWRPPYTGSRHRADCMQICWRARLGLGDTFLCNPRSLPR
jgi:hypothetical protein